MGVSDMSSQRGSISPTPQKVGEMAKYSTESGRVGPEDHPMTKAEGARDRPSINDYILMQKDVLIGLRGAIEELGNRLNPILLPPTPSPSGSKGEDSPEQSQIAHSIDDNTDLARYATYDLVDLLHRIQL